MVLSGARMQSELKLRSSNVIIGEHIQPAYISTPHGRVHYLEAGAGTGTKTKAIVLFHETPLSAKSFLPTMPYLFSPTVCWFGLMMKRCGCSVQILQMY